MIQSRLARPIIQNISKRTAVLPASASEFRYTWFFFEFLINEMITADLPLSMSNRTFTLVIHHTPVWVHRPCPRSGTVTIRSFSTSSQRPLPTGWLQKWERAPSTPLSTPVFSLLCPRLVYLPFLLIVSKVLEKCANKILLGNPLLPRWGFGSLRFLDDLVIHQLDCWQGYLPSSRWEAHRRVWPPLCRQGARLGWLVSLNFKKCFIFQKFINKI